MAEQESSPTANQADPVTRGARKTRTGEVVSSSMNKTIVVRTVTRVPHPKFGKIGVKCWICRKEERPAEAPAPPAAPPPPPPEPAAV